jgi:PQQ-dependent dehydrogenase (methanol/ethanol family)
MVPTAENLLMRFVSALLLATGLASAQSAPGASSAKLVEAGEKAFAEHCAECHGDDAEGSDRGPALGGNRRLRTRSTEQIRSFIYEGKPSSGMPAFHLAAADLDSLAAFAHSLNSVAADSAAPGSPQAGEQFFFGRGQCASCHMIRGRGKPVGPDLSSAGREMTLSEIREVLLHPDARITPGYELVTVRLRDGQSIRGFARGRTNFDIQLQSLDGQFHLLREEQIAAIQDDKQSLMKPLAAAPAERRDLIAYLSSLTGVEAGFSPPPNNDRLPGESEVDFKRIQNPEPGDWPTYDGKLNGNRYSGLNQINASNVAKLAVQWVFPVDHFGVEATPLVVDGLMYITGPNQAIALDARTGRMIWSYSRPRTPSLVGDASLGTNRGVALLGDKVFMMTDNAHLLALHRITGRLVWEVVMPEEPQHYGSTVAPLIVKGTVISGVSGGDRGIRGFLSCYNAATGERLWRRFTIPLKGEPGSDTWKGTEPVFGGGATWLTGAYDSESDTLFWPTGNPWPDSNDVDRPGDNLYSNSILALDPATGALKWHYQFTPHDTHDWDATEPPLLIDTEYKGGPRKLLLHGDRNGFFYVLDRTNGKVLLAKPLAHRVNWTLGIGPDGRPLPPPPDDPTSPDRGRACPSSAANWNSAAFSPSTRLFYVLTVEDCQERRSGNWKPGSPSQPGQKVVRAIDIDTGNIAWEIPQIGPVIAKTWPGIMATAGGLVFYGDPNGAFAAVDERQGKSLWHFATNVLMTASPMTYMVDGKQFVAVAAGPNILSFSLP